jgi:hypothetical protein
VRTRLPVKLKVAVLSAALTFAILCVFAVVVGAVAEQRIVAGFDDDLRATVGELQDKITLELVPGGVQLNDNDRSLLAAAAAGVLLWIAAQIDRGSNGGYWAAYGIVAAAGLVVGLAQIRGRNGHPPLMFLLVFLPVLVAAGWVLLAMQPHSNWFRSHVLAWSGDIGIRDLVHDLGTWLGVLAFGIGYTLGLVLEPAPARVVEEEPVGRPATTPVAYDRTAADEPLTAERREVVTDDAGRRVVTDDGERRFVADDGEGRVVTDDARAREADRVR